MRKSKYLLLIPIFAALMFFTACKETATNPVIPHISIKYTMLSDTVDNLENDAKLLTVVFDLKDGDGDIGLRTRDTTGAFHPDSLYHYNCFVSMYKVENNDTLPAELRIPLQYRIPYVEPEGGNKNLEAEVYVNMIMTLGMIPLDYDQVMFDLYIYDRAFHKSNTIETPVVPFYSTGVYYPNP